MNIKLPFYLLLLLAVFSCKKSGDKDSASANRNIDLTEEESQKIAQQNANEERELFFEHCPIPEEVFPHIGGKDAIVDNSSLDNEWSEQAGIQDELCPTFKVGDFTGDGKEDFVGIVQKTNSDNINIIVVRDFKNAAKVDTLDKPIIGPSGAIETGIVNSSQPRSFQVYNFGKNIVKYTWTSNAWNKEELPLPEEYPNYPQ